MSKSRRHLARLTAATPVLALGLLVTLPYVFRIPRVDRDEFARRQAEVQAAFDAFPDQLEGWQVTEAEVPQPAIRLLQPSAILARQYVRLGGGPWTDFLIIHCPDARDMQGHYPPNCYPANGWVGVQDDAGPKTVIVHGGGGGVPLLVYEFRRRDTSGVERWIRVFNAFVLPDGQLTSTNAGLHGAAGDFAESVRGAAQLQLITPGYVPIEDAIEDLRVLLEHARPLLDLLSKGSDDHSAA